MSRTYRRQPEERSWFRRNYRRPKTFNEKKQIDELIYDQEFPLRNRDKAKLNNLPSDWNDIRKSSSYELDYD